jgi:hypothetical protein
MTDLLPEEAELARLESEWAQLFDTIVARELELETAKSDMARFRARYYARVGRSYAELDSLEAKIAAARSRAHRHDPTLASAAKAAQDRAHASAEELGLQERAPLPAVITPELKRAFRRAAALLHPDRASTDQERDRRHAYMVRLNEAYEGGDLAAIEALVREFGQDPDQVDGNEAGARLVRVLRRLAQGRARLAAIEQELGELNGSELATFRKQVEDQEQAGADPLGDLSASLERRLDSARQTLSEFVSGGQV